ncbi:OmpA family protein [Flavobacteriales bacterium]|nr:OmpA family protein [Flavobacteriales bacterium]
MKALITFSYFFFLWPVFAFSGQNPGDPDTNKIGVDSIQYRMDSLIHLGNPRYTYSQNFVWADSSEASILRTPEYYKDRYKEKDLMYKVVDNWGKGFDSLYGTRNLRPILHGIAYRGGANNYFHETKKRRNSNPLPADGIDNLCSEGFSHSVYLYRTNFDNAPVSHSCNCENGGINKMKYSQFDYYDTQHVYDMLEIVHKSALNDSVGPVYLHCWNGWHASGFISAIILKQFCGMSDLEATAYWDLGTDGANTSPRYNKIREDIKNFKPYPEFILIDSLGNKVCPPMPDIIDSSMLHITVEHLAIVPEAIPVGTIMIMNKVKFGPNKTTLSSPGNNPDLKYLLEALEKSPSLKVEIAGHTDRSGKAATNKVLSTKRAQWVFNYLVKKGIPAERMVFKGYGHFKPAYTNKTKEGRSANRRIEVKVLSKKHSDLTKLANEDSFEEAKELSISKISTYDVGTSIILDKVIFEPGLSELTDPNYAQLNELSEVLTKHASIAIELGGFTDKSGIPEKNLLLSEERAKAVWNYLTERGIDSARLSHHGYGDAKPIAPNKYRWGRDKNRRIEVKLIAL